MSSLHKEGLINENKIQILHQVTTKTNRLSSQFSILKNRNSETYSCLP